MPCRSNSSDIIDLSSSFVVGFILSDLDLDVMCIAIITY